MKKKFIFLSLLLLMPLSNVKASSGLIDIYSSDKYPKVGNTFTVTAYCKSSSTIGTCEYVLTYDTSKLKLEKVNDTTSCNGLYCSYYAGNNSSSKTFVFKSIASGSSVIGAKSYVIYDMDEKEMQTTVSGVTINASNPSSSGTTTTIYSTNNNLKELKVEGQNITPTFNKNTLEYKLSLDSSVEQIKILATPEDNKATINGTGIQKVSEGENKFNIVVTSEKGTKKTYTLIVTLKDENPITIKIDDKDYTIVKKKSVLTAPKNYKDKELTINNQKVPAFYNEITKYTLVGLKDSDGKINLYVYDENKNTYSLYKEYQFNSIYISPIAITDKMSSYTKTTMKINDEELTVYKASKGSNYALIYGMNIETGDIGWYMYEQTENTIQKYDDTDLKTLTKQLSAYKKLIYELFIGIGFLCVLLLIVAVSKTKNKKSKKVKKEVKQNTNKEITDKTSKVEETKEEQKEIDKEEA